MHPLTACHTHELLGCHCIPGTADGVGSAPLESPSADENESGEDEIEDFDEDLDKNLKDFMPASQYKPPKVRKKVSLTHRKYLPLT